MQRLVRGFLEADEPRPHVSNSMRTMRAVRFIGSLVRRFMPSTAPVDRLSHWFLFGGCVRDFLCGDTPKDYDLMAPSYDIAVRFDRYINSRFGSGVRCVRFNHGLYSSVRFELSLHASAPSAERAHGSSADTPLNTITIDLSHPKAFGCVDFACNNLQIALSDSAFENIRLRCNTAELGFDGLKDGSAVTDAQLLEICMNDARCRRARWCIDRSAKHPFLLALDVLRLHARYSRLSAAGYDMQAPPLTGVAPPCIIRDEALCKPGAADSAAPAAAPAENGAPHLTILTPCGHDMLYPCASRVLATGPSVCSVCGRLLLYCGVRNTAFFNV